MSEQNGSFVIANALKSLGVEHIFGIVGIPVIEVAEACIALGIRFIAFRNEQSAAYAASIYGYLTGKPGVCLVVGGPGVVHALAGVENANSNRFPLLLLAGSAETRLRGMGAFQQLDQVSLVKAAGAKFAEQPSSLAALPRLVEQAYKVAFYGKPGTSYIDLPANLIQASLPAGTKSGLSSLLPPLSPPRTLGDPQRVAACAVTLKEARFPLLVIGKGCAYARAEVAIRNLQSMTNLAFLPTPMGKGVISDHDPRNMSAARSAVLKNADAILFLGARLNWIMHFGAPGKYNSNVQIMQVDSVGDELHGASFGSRYLGIQSDLELFANQLASELNGWKAPALPDVVEDKRKTNEAKAETQEAPPSSQASAAKEVQLTYHTVYRVIREALQEQSPNNVVYVSEGANTMDVSRTSFPLTVPRTRLDAGTNATMGVGMGYAISAKVAKPDSVVVAIEGDSAFGFSAMELETAVRSKLPMIIYVMNNSGVYHGADPDLYSQKLNPQHKPLPSTALSLETAYHDLARSLGALGFEARTLDEVRRATIDALKSNRVAVINVLIDPGKDKKLEFGWMASSKL